MVLLCSSWLIDCLLHGCKEFLLYFLSTCFILLAFMFRSMIQVVFYIAYEVKKRAS